MLHLKGISTWDSFEGANFKYHERVEAAHADTMKNRYLQVKAMRLIC